jgi:hypothetical protein
MFENSMNIVLRPTRNTYVEIPDMKANELIHEPEDIFSRRWNTGRVWTFINCVHDDVSRSLCLVGDHFFEAFYHCGIARFLHPTVVCGIESGEYVTTGIGLSRELDEE